MKGITENLRICSACLLTALAFSCNFPITKKEELIDYINAPSNGLVKTKQVGKISVTLTYAPWELIAAKQGFTQMESAKKRQFKDKWFFILRLSANDRELLRQLEYSQYSELVQVLSFRMDQFILLTPSDGKPIEPESCQFQQTYGIAKANSVLVVFNPGKIRASKTFIVRINEFGLNTGDLAYEFKVKDLDQIPSIEI